MIVYFVIMTFVPLIFLIGISFTEWNIISPPRWVGFANIAKRVFQLRMIGSI